MNTIRINSRNSKMVAHRGVSGLEKENTLCAFVAAGNRSYYGVETDVHRTGDGQFAIIHDDNTRRVGGEARVLEVETTDLATLRSLPLQDVDGSDGRVDLRIPTLREYIRCCKKYGKDCVLELKNRIPTEDIARMVAEIREEEYLEHVIFIGFSVENMTDLRQLLPDQTQQLIVGARVVFSVNLSIAGQAAFDAQAVRKFRYFFCIGLYMLDSFGTWTDNRHIAF